MLKTYKCKPFTEWKQSKLMSLKGQNFPVEKFAQAVTLGKFPKAATFLLCLL